MIAYIDIFRFSAFALMVTLVLTLLASSFVIYSSLYLAPGNPIATLTGGFDAWKAMVPGA